jgi:hypothetical protein
VASSTFEKRLPLLLLQPSDIAELSGIRFEPQRPHEGMVLLPKDPRRGALWYMPVASRTAGDGTTQLWYLRTDNAAAAHNDQRILCLGEIRAGQWELPAVRPGSPSWGGLNNVVMTRSPHAATWGGFNVFQIVPAEEALEMLYWDQPDTAGKAGAMRALSCDGREWEKLPGVVFTDYNDAFSLIRIGDEYTLYQTALKPWPDKPYPDNIDKSRRVITLRTSLDLRTWSAQRPILVPDARDAAETEFYLFKVFRYGLGYAGLLMKYYADPARPREHSAILRFELAVSEDGRAWQRPYRDTDLGFWSYADPFVVGDEMHFAISRDGGMVTVTYRKDRLVAAVGEGSLLTRPFERPTRGIALNADTRPGWIEVTLSDGAGKPVAMTVPHRVAGVEGTCLPLPWDPRGLPPQFSLRISMGGGAKLFGVTERL